MSTYVVNVIFWLTPPPPSDDNVIYEQPLISKYLRLFGKVHLRDKRCFHFLFLEHSDVFASHVDAQSGQGRGLGINKAIPSGAAAFLATL